ncbi:lysylphosphatidylglycerol synthase transmembrane domain-containing protein [Pedococcus sp. P5_B7]
MTLTERSGDPARAADGLATTARRLARSPLARRLGGGAVLGFLVWRLGVEQSVRAVGAIDARALAAALVLTALTTFCCAWRWSLVAAALGAQVPLRTAVAACYRSQFLNTATPGGVLGDVHRGVRHGRRTGSAARGLRSVLMERSAGQVVQAGMALVALSVLPSPVRSSVAWAWAAVVVIALCVGLAGRSGRRRGRDGLGSAWMGEVRRGVLARRTGPLVALASALAVAGHVLTFLVAARTAGSTASATRLVPLAFVVLIAMGIPVNIAGWGPREGVAAWVFGAAGLGAGAGLSTAVVYGVLVLVASLPGAAVLVVARGRARPRPAVGRVAEEVARG